ncbi:MAG: SpoIID/LytB domain-containing protein [Armatimonadetes bacterium]|nr:SpoIID/LytB domain-containing protein [Armatimonadota bacterium]
MRSLWISFLFVFFLFPLCAWGNESVPIRVLLSSGQSWVRADSSSGLVVVDSYTGERLAEARSARLAPKGNRLRLGKKLLTTSCVDIEPAFPEYPMRLDGGRWYRGSFRVRNERGRLSVVNVLPLESYLYSVVGSEVSPDWPLESLKAQAVAARTYALWRMEENSQKIYDVVDTVADQVYNGYHWESSRIRQAVLATRGEVITHDGRPIKAYYHAACGGHTEDADYVFPDAPFLKGVICEFCRNTPHFSWSRIFDAGRVRSVLAARGIRVGPILEIKPESHSSSGRVDTLAVVHSWGTRLVAGARFRMMLGPGTLKSTRFSIAPQGMYARSSGETAHLPASRAGGRRTFRFSGRGWGHGVGMCQWGARGMANAGYTYRQILNHYYADQQIMRIP